MSMTPRILAYKAVDTILNQPRYTPGWYHYWHSLPTKGRYSAHNIRRKAAQSLVATFFPRSFITALLTACLSAEGTPEAKGAELYTWMVKHLYAGKSERLYTDWLSTQ